MQTPHPLRTSSASSETRCAWLGYELKSSLKYRWNKVFDNIGKQALHVMEKREEDNERQKGQAVKSSIPLLLTILVLFSVFVPTKAQDAHVENRW